MQGSLIPNNSSLLSDVNYITNIRLSTVIFSAKDTVIQNFDSKSFKFKVIQNLDLIVPIHKKSDNKTLKSIVQFLYFRFVVKYLKDLKDLFLWKCLTISPLINYL